MDWHLEPRIPNSCVAYMEVGEGLQAGAEALLSASQ